MKYAVEIGSGGLIYMRSFIKIGSGIQKLMGAGGFTDTYHDDFIRLLLGKGKAIPVTGHKYP
jgi:hypothetical protein